MPPPGQPHFGQHAPLVESPTWKRRCTRHGQGAAATDTRRRCAARHAERRPRAPPSAARHATSAFRPRRSRRVGLAWSWPSQSGGPALVGPGLAIPAKRASVPNSPGEGPAFGCRSVPAQSRQFSLAPSGLLAYFRSAAATQANDFGALNAQHSVGVSCSCCRGADGGYGHAARLAPFVPALLPSSPARGPRSRRRR